MTIIELRKIAEQLSKTGKYGKCEVISEIWHDGGGAPIYLEDLIEVLDTEIQKKTRYPAVRYAAEKYKKAKT